MLSVFMSAILYEFVYERSSLLSELQNVHRNLERLTVFSVIDIPSLSLPNIASIFEVAHKVQMK